MSLLVPDAPRARLLELTSEEWAVLAGGAALAVAATAYLRSDVTGWVVPGLFFSALVVGHLCMTARRFVAFPDLIAVAACLQWVVAPWLAAAYPARMLAFHMTLPPNVYLSYALPATIALWIGLHLPTSRKLSRSWTMPAIDPLAPHVRRTLDGIIVLGLIADAYSSGLPVQWAFLSYLVGSLRFVAALGWMVTRTPGWHWRVAVVMIIFTAVQSSNGTFYLVIHWGGFFLLVYAFMARWRWKLAWILLGGVLVIGALQQVKPRFRASLDEQTVGPADSMVRLGTMMWDQVRGTSGVATNADFGDLLVRFNQGWIISRIMTHVPIEEPFAEGTTLADAAVFSIVPRFLFPSKREGASTQLFRRFTGIDLAVGTHMGLGIIGELYANFGAIGGVISTFLYGLAIGGVFLLFADRAQSNPLWWAASSMVLLPSVEPGFNIEDIMNHVVKAAVVLVVLWKLLPPLQRVLSTGNSEAWSDDDVVSTPLTPAEGLAMIDYQPSIDYGLSTGPAHDHINTGFDR